ncbi:lytic transglycosylase domain-containing protein [Jannaschia sp. Os4]|uniref:lytic transglycosylase domain-containing protein n=1 Tax=Jannaschia sp. Os4 TaxID=2807617 RepID=UPI00193A690F|nr:lytic transglycosylase domain-containing protein [Jannaschia sp. Os4]MBM2574843.1 lytic transglycosylase domain-containing protein [Jannaschia sp. Os4]
MSHSFPRPARPGARALASRLSAAALAAALVAPLAAPPALAEGFTFKRVGVTRGGIADQIQGVRTARPGRPTRLPQIQPAATPVLREGPTVSPEGRRREAANHQGWFWSEVSPEIGRRPGRFGRAAERVAEAPADSGVRAPSLERLRRIADVHGQTILRHSVGTQVSPALVLALISVESAGRIDAVSNKGATGLMQLIPATAARFGVRDSRDPAQNIKGGIAYLDWLLREFEGDAVLALAGYNAGEGAVKRAGGVPNYAETRAYVPKVAAAWNVARLLCATPPTLPSDGCVFSAGLRVAGSAVTD